MIKGASLTVRGGCFLGCGIAATAAAILFGQRDLLRLGILLLAVPAAALLLVGRSQLRLTALRLVEPGRVGVGGHARVSVRLTNMSRLPTGVLLLEDRVPLTLGARPRFVLDRLIGREHRDIAYTVRPAARGRHQVGPLSLRLTDPLGLWEISRDFPSTAELVVTPRLVALPSLPVHGWSAGGLRQSAVLPSGGEDDVSIREYRHGDSLHRVHWRATARHGEVMVRREDGREQARALVLLDNRAAVHRGSGSRSTFEDAVSVTASLAVGLLARGYALTLRTMAGAAAFPATGTTELDEMLQAMTDLSLQHAPPTAAGPAPEELHGERRPSLVVAVLRGVDTELADVLTGWPGRGAAATALVLGAPPTGTDGSAESGESVLAAAGWRLVRTTSLTDLPRTWPEVVAPAVGAVPGVAAGWSAP